MANPTFSIGAGRRRGRTNTVMLSNPVPPKRCCDDWCWRIAALLLVLASAGLHLGYLAYQCPLDLAPDEAHYWDWSRHLDWSYYSKGPLVAYLIRAGCELFGPLARSISGTEMPAVRLPAELCSAGLLIAVYVLTSQTFGREMTSLWDVIIAF